MGKKLGLLAGFLVGFWFVAMAFRTSMNPEAGAEFAQGLSVLPLSGGIFAVLNAFMHVDTRLFNITTSPFLPVSFLVLIVQGAIQSPLMILLNMLFGPFLFSPYQRGGYSIAADPNYGRAKNKLMSKIWKLLGSFIATICIALFAAWLVDYALSWVNAQMIILRILIYILIFAVVVAIVVLPFVIASQAVHDVMLRILGNLVQSCLYAFITNACIIAVVAATTAGSSLGQIAITLLVFLAWMIIYTDTDGFFIHNRSLAAS